MQSFEFHAISSIYPNILLLNIPLIVVTLCYIDIAINPLVLNPLRKYQGTVKSVLDFGAFVDIGAESDGLLHISRISQDRG